jgi:hypothetical protein
MQHEQEFIQILKEIEESTEKQILVITEIKNKLIVYQHFDDAFKVRSIEKKLIELLDSARVQLTLPHKD